MNATGAGGLAAVAVLVTYHLCVLVNSFYLGVAIQLGAAAAFDLVLHKQEAGVGEIRSGIVSALVLSSLPWVVAGIGYACYFILFSIGLIMHSGWRRHSGEDWLLGVTLVTTGVSVFAYAHVRVPKSSACTICFSATLAWWMGLINSKAATHSSSIFSKTGVASLVLISLACIDGIDFEAALQLRTIALTMLGGVIIVLIHWLTPKQDAQRGEFLVKYLAAFMTGMMPIIAFGLIDQIPPLIYTSQPLIGIPLVAAGSLAFKLKTVPNQSDSPSHHCCAEQCCRLCEDPTPDEDLEIACNMEPKIDISTQITLKPRLRTKCQTLAKKTLSEEPATASTIADQF